jgi:hypothetical protein
MSFLIGGVKDPRQKPKPPAPEDWMSCLTPTLAEFDETRDF